MKTLYLLSILLTSLTVSFNAWAETAPRTIIQTMNFSKDAKTSGYPALNKWEVREEKSKVANAVEVYKRKSQKVDQNRLVVVDRTNPNKTIIIDDAAGMSADQLIFTPSEDFAYYVGSNGVGSYGIYGINLGTQEKFQIGSERNFILENCPDQKSYVVVKTNPGGKDYIVYDTYGKKVKDLSDVASPQALKNFVCY